MLADGVMEMIKSLPPVLSATWLVLCCLLLALSGCSGRKGSPQQQLEPDPIFHPAVVADAVAQQVALPAPSSLAGKANAASSFDDRLCFGNQWEAALPNNKVADSTFSPQYAGAAGRTLADCAYAIYGFGELNLYHGEPVIKLRWLDALDQPQNVYVALANRQLDRWDWFKMPASGDVAVPSLGPYQDAASEGMVAVVSLDNGDFGLDYVLWGDAYGINVNLVTDLNPNPVYNIAPLTVNFDVSGSVSYGGVISGYDFDWEDDGVFDLTGNTDGLVQHVFSAGKQRVAISATDDLGQSSTTYLNFVSIDPNNQPPIASFTLSPNNGDGPLTVSCDASSSSDPDGSIVEYRWDFDGDGTDDFISPSAQTSHVFARAGTSPVRLTIEDNYFREATQSKVVTIQHGWHESVIDSAADARTPVALCTSGSPGRASVAYIDTYNHELRFCHANNDQGSTWGAVRIPASAEFGLVGQVSMVTSIGSGVPIICYGDFENSYGLFTVTAANPAGGSWLSPVLVDGSNHTGLRARMSLVNTIPVIAAAATYSQQDRNDVFYYTAKDLDAADWNAPSIVLPMQDGIEYGQPAIGYSANGLFKTPFLLIPRFEDGQAISSTLVRAADVSGSNWNPGQAVAAYMEAGSFVMSAGCPAFCGATATAGGTIAFYRSVNADGTSFPASPHNIVYQGGQAVGVIHGGVPEIYYYTPGLDDILLLRAKDSLGDEWDQPYAVAENLNYSGGQLGVTLVNGEPVLAFAWRGDVGVYELHSASWY